MKFLRKDRTSATRTFAIAFLLGIGLLFGAQVGTARAGVIDLTGAVNATKPWCSTDKSKPGVLISGEIVVQESSKKFSCYIHTLLKENMPYVILVAVLLVVASGIQYMVAMGSPGEQAKAKTRILGVLAGIIFYFLLQYLIPLIVGGVRI